MTLSLQEVHWDLKSLLTRRKVRSMRNPIQLNLSIKSIFVVRKLSEYLQLNHIACAGLFVEVTSIFLCIILRSRYCLPFHACAWCVILLLFYEFLLGTTKYLVSANHWFMKEDWLMCYQILCFWLASFGPLNSLMHTFLIIRFQILLTNSYKEVLVFWESSWLNFSEFITVSKFLIHVYWFIYFRWLKISMLFGSGFWLKNCTSLAVKGICIQLFLSYQRLLITAVKK